MVFDSWQDFIIAGVELMDCVQSSDRLSGHLLRA